MKISFKIKRKIKKYSFLLIFLLVFLFQSNSQILSALPMENYQSEMVIEELRLKVPADIREIWLMTEKQILKWVDQEAEELIANNQLLEGKLYPEEPAKLALFLASEQSSKITKQIINLDAGWI